MITPYPRSPMAVARGYLASRRNLAGSALALLGGGLVLVDPVGPVGIVLVVAFYALGALAVPTKRMPRYGFDPRQLQHAIQEEIAKVSGLVPPEVISRIQAIELTIRSEILPHLDAMPLGSRDLYLVERTATEDLPAAVDAYIGLPAGYVSTQPDTRGQTALSLLLEQLDLMESEMRRVAEVVHRADMDRLLVQRRFLLDRFRRPNAGAAAPRDSADAGS